MSIKSEYVVFRLLLGLSISIYTNEWIWINKNPFWGIENFRKQFLVTLRHSKDLNITISMQNFRFCESFLKNSNESNFINELLNLCGCWSWRIFKIVAIIQTSHKDLFQTLEKTHNTTRFAWPSFVFKLTLHFISKI